MEIWSSSITSSLFFSFLIIQFCDFEKLNFIKKKNAKWIVWKEILWLQSHHPFFLGISPKTKKELQKGSSFFKISYPQTKSKQIPFQNDKIIETCNKLNISLRPHIKTHKTIKGKINKEKSQILIINKNKRSIMSDLWRTQYFGVQKWKEDHGIDTKWSAILCRKWFPRYPLCCSDLSQQIQ